MTGRTDFDFTGFAHPASHHVDLDSEDDRAALDLSDIDEDDLTTVFSEHDDEDDEDD